MADNLNVPSVGQDSGSGSPINKEPSQSPLEQSGPNNSTPGQTPVTPTPPAETPNPVGAQPPIGGEPPIAEPPQPAGPNPSEPPFPPNAPSADFNPGDASATPAGPTPAQPSPSEPNPSPTPEPPAPQEPPAPPPPPAPPADKPDLGQSASPPDTDEFLKSILQEQPQSTATQSASDTSFNKTDTVNDVSENIPLQQQTTTDNFGNPTEGPANADLNDKSFDQTPTNTPEASVETLNEQQSQVNALPSNDFPEGPKLTDNVTLPQSAPVPPQVNPSEPGQGSDELGAIQPRGSSIGRTILLVILGLAVIAGGYYAYTRLFSGSNSSPSKPVALTATTSAAAATADTQRKEDLLKIQQALIDFKAASNQFPISASYTFLNQSGNILEKELVPTYLDKLPQDPTPAKSYAYKSDGNTFSLTAELDDASDPQVTIISGKALYEVTDKTVSSSASAFPASGVQATSTATSASALNTSTTDEIPPIPSSP